MIFNFFLFALKKLFLIKLDNHKFNFFDYIMKFNNSDSHLKNTHNL